MRFHRFHQVAEPGKPVPVDQSSLVKFLQSLRNTKVPAWRRLQAAEAICVHHNAELRTDDVDFDLIRRKLRELAAKEQRGSTDAVDSKLVPGEGNAGKVDADEPQAIGGAESFVAIIFTIRRLHRNCGGG